MFMSPIVMTFYCLGLFVVVYQKLEHVYTTKWMGPVSSVHEMLRTCVQNFIPYWAETGRTRWGILKVAIFHILNWLNFGRSCVFWLYYIIQHMTGSMKIQTFWIVSIHTCSFTTLNIGNINGCVTKCYRLTDSTIVDPHPDIILLT